MCQLTVNWHICSHLVPQKETCQFDSLSEHKPRESTAIFDESLCWLCEQSPSEFINAMVTTQLTAQDVINALGVSENHPNLMTIIGKYFDRYENGHMSNMMFRFDRVLDGLDMPRPEGHEQNLNAQLNALSALAAVNNAHTSATVQAFPQLQAQGLGASIAGNQSNMAITSMSMPNGGNVSSDQQDTVNPAHMTVGNTTADPLDLDEMFPTLDDHQSLITMEHLESLQAHREMDISDTESSDSEDSVGTPGVENTVRQSTPANAATKAETNRRMTSKISGNKQSPPARTEFHEHVFELDRVMSEDQNITSQLQSNISYPLYARNPQINDLTSVEHREFSSSNLHHLTVITALNHQLETQGPSYELVQALSKEVSEGAQEMQVIGERWHRLSDAVMRNISRYTASQLPEPNTGEGILPYASTPSD
ncbi:hypothetical protein DTO027B5_8423 [Paecilomyces variotii]|nr:hypothetical protein DTO169C6_8368 [Paecilomyces variotii]KAJ9320774.1 hypothetical protein DTO027B3_8243 [Paecilomyces variotii]KAJ9329389.1 hypothetical protein DTO027B5_8423 [Paecilomyces variotii]KAJ9394504.1 hypothetical protein DTO282F9_8555 [Paecilomyces variotii]KAJ9404324.1 hypothetical protein DTO045G8_7933 [Paecilomyces variotii]